jgi:hypothetical protein
MFWVYRGFEAGQPTETGWRRTSWQHVGARHPRKQGRTVLARRRPIVDAAVRRQLPRRRRRAGRVERGRGLGCPDEGAHTSVRADRVGGEKRAPHKGTPSAMPVSEDAKRACRRSQSNNAAPCTRAPSPCALLPLRPPRPPAGRQLEPQAQRQRVIVSPRGLPSITHSLEDAR